MAYNAEYSSSSQMSYGDKNPDREGDQYSHQGTKNDEQYPPSETSYEVLDRDYFDAVIRMTKSGFRVQGYSDNRGVSFVHYEREPRTGVKFIASCIGNCLPSCGGRDRKPGPRGGYDTTGVPESLQTHARVYDGNLETPLKNDHGYAK
jgi:hypothetical protein